MPQGVMHNPAITTSAGFVVAIVQDAALQSQVTHFGTDWVPQIGNNADIIELATGVGGVILGLSGVTGKWRKLAMHPEASQLLMGYGVGNLGIFLGRKLVQALGKLPANSAQGLAAARAAAAARARAAAARDGGYGAAVTSYSGSQGFARGLRGSLG